MNANPTCHEWGGARFAHFAMSKSMIDHQVLRRAKAMVAFSLEKPMRNENEAGLKWLGVLAVAGYRVNGRQRIYLFV